MMAASPESNLPGAAPAIRVALVDDHAAFRRALRMMLETRAGIEVVGEAGDGEEALTVVIECCAEVVCMDVLMPRMNGIEATRRLLAMNPALKVIGLSGMFEGPVVAELLDAGAWAYVNKGDSSEQLPGAIVAAALGRKQTASDGGAGAAGAAADASTQKSVHLGARERQILQLIAEGCTPMQIAERLSLNLSTVEVHTRKIMRKLDLQNIAELTDYAIRTRGMAH